MILRVDPTFPKCSIPKEQRAVQKLLWVLRVCFFVGVEGSELLSLNPEPQTLKRFRALV